MADTSDAIQAIEDMKQRLSSASELDTLASQIESLKKNVASIGDLSALAEQVAKLKEGLKLTEQAQELQKNLDELNGKLSQISVWDRLRTVGVGLIDLSNAIKEVLDLQGEITEVTAESQKVSEQLKTTNENIVALAQVMVESDSLKSLGEQIKQLGGALDTASDRKSVV